MTVPLAAEGETVAVRVMPVPVVVLVDEAASVVLVTGRLLVGITGYAF